jgi:hypothetical protein
MLFNILIQPAEGVIDATMEHQFSGSFLDLFRRNLIQESNRVVVHHSPKMWVQVGEKGNDLWMPRPPEVLSQRAKSFMKMIGRACH